MEEKQFCNYCQQWRDAAGHQMIPVRAKTSTTKKTAMRFQCYECFERRRLRIPPNAPFPPKKG